MKVGFTGTRESLTPMQVVQLTSLLRHAFPSSGVHEFHHGDCVGADAFAHNFIVNLQSTRLAYHAWYHIWTIGHPPLNQAARAFTTCNAWRPPREYLVRNHDIVDETELLIAAPATEEEVMRSGTWATIRYARMFSKHINIVLPLGDVIVENSPSS